MELIKKATQGEIHHIRRNEILMMTIGTPEHSSQVRGYGWEVNFTKVWHESRTCNTILRSEFEAYNANMDAYKVNIDAELKRLHDMLAVM